MQDAQVIVDWLNDLTRAVHAEVESLSQEELTWQPDPGANNIAVTVWHMARWFDLLLVRAFDNRPPEEEQWHTRGWKNKTGYDPRGIGYKGFGAVTGYTLEEVTAIPILSAPELLAYFDQTCQALCERVAALPSEGLSQTAPGLGGQRTLYGWVKPILQGCFGHVGEVQAIKAMRARTLLEHKSLA